MISEISNNYLNHEMKIVKFVISLCLYMYLLVDTIAGFLISRNLPNIGQLYKIFVVLMMLFYIVTKKANMMLIINFLFALMFVIPLNCLSSDFADFSQSMMVPFKSISIFVFYEYFQVEIDNDEIDKIFLVNYIVFVLNIFAGVLGYGKGSYKYGEGSVGTTGFFYAGNEVSFTFVCLTFWFLIRYNMKKPLKYGISLLLSVMIGTKSGMLATLLLIFFDVYYSAKQKNRPKIIIVSLIVMVCICFFVYSFLQDIPLYEYISFKIKQHSGRGNFPILNALLSGRIERLPIIQEIYDQNFSLVTFALGLGFPIQIIRIEMDFFEYYYYFGFIAFSLLVLFYLNILYISWKRNNKKQFWFNIICIVISFLAGHVVYSVMGGIFFAMINSKVYKEGVRENSRTRKIIKIRKIIFAYNYK